MVSLSNFYFEEVTLEIDLKKSKVNKVNKGEFIVLY